MIGYQNRIDFLEPETMSRMSMLTKCVIGRSFVSDSDDGCTRRLYIATSVAE